MTPSEREAKAFKMLEQTSRSYMYIDDIAKFLYGDYGASIVEGDLYQLGYYVGNGLHSTFVSRGRAYRLADEDAKTVWAFALNQALKKDSEDTK